MLSAGLSLNVPTGATAAGTKVKTRYDHVAWKPDEKRNHFKMADIRGHVEREQRSNIYRFSVINYFQFLNTFKDPNHYI